VKLYQAVFLWDAELCSGESVIATFDNESAAETLILRLLEIRPNDDFRVVDVELNPTLSTIRLEHGLH